jgi:hypothetical protein
MEKVPHRPGEYRRLIMSIEIYYFSETGNSRHVAEELQQRLPAAILTPIVRLLPQDSIRAGANAVDFVFPTTLRLRPYRSVSLPTVKRSNV